MKVTNSPDVIVLPEENVNIKTFKQVIPVTVHHYYITDAIVEPDKYLDLIHTLKTSEVHDTIFLYLNTPGGYLSTAIQIMSAMKQSNATVITSIEGEVCSAGTLIFLSGDKYIINPNSTFMIHNYSAWIGGKGNEIAAHAKYREEYAKELMNDVYKDFLTESEIQDVLDGKDIWLSSNSVIKRLADKEKLVVEEVDIQTALTQLPELLTKLLKENNSVANVTATAVVPDITIPKENIKEKPKKQPKVPKKPLKKPAK